MNRLVLTALFPLRYYAYLTTVPAGRPAAVYVPAEPAEQGRALRASA
jgi:hypothetical protein